MGLSYRASRVLERLHTAIQTRGQHGLDYFRCRLHEQCLDGKKREATERDFVAAAGDGGVLSQEEARVLFRELSGNGKDSSVAFAEVMFWPCCVAVVLAVLRQRRRNALRCRRPCIRECAHLGSTMSRLALRTTMLLDLECWVKPLNQRSSNLYYESLQSRIFR